MKVIKPIKPIVLMCLLSASYGSFASTSFHKDVVEAKARTEFYFIQTAKSSRITPIPTRPGYYTLTLEHVDSEMTYLSDRPNRISGTVPIVDFLSHWQSGQNSFAKDAPNADIYARVMNGIGKGERYNFAVEIMEPHYNMANNSETYVIHPLAGNKHVIPADAKIRSTALFIDWCASCIG